MVTGTKGKVLVTAKIESIDDLAFVRKGLLAESDVRSVEASDALVDTVSDFSGIASNLPVIIGQIPPEAKDRVVDVKGQRPIGNPEHGGEEMVDIL